ncbi:DEAD/DEAH box helicase [Devosia sp.]|uniref:DEAD/DEAH box helicase n=1 Tax=Devosia sp. TaxID=1871048 RepID=UPI0032670DC5
MTEDFSGLGLSAKVTEAVTAAGYTKPTDIQAQAIPHVLQKKDVIGIAQTGTGKTASFVLPMLHLLENGRARARMPRTLILEPTRELAAQVSENFEKYGKNHRLTMALIIGGVSFEDQNKKLDRGVDVLIATPGRLLDQIERGKIMLNGVEILVIDEADRMLDMGFIDDIEKIVNRLPVRRQTMLFSATMDSQIEKLTKKFLKDPVHVQVSRAASTAETIDQKLVKVGSKPEEKRDSLRQLIRAAGETLTNGIVFCNRKRDVGVVAKSLSRHGFDAGELHGDMDQKSRTETLDAFRGGRLKILVASDVAARGLDIPAVSHVFNFDVPVHAEDYVHRIGRTGRAGRAGAALTLVAPADHKHLDAILKLIQRDIAWLETGKSTAAAAPAADAEGEAPATGEEKPVRRRRGAQRGRPERPAGEARPVAETRPVAERPAKTIEAEAAEAPPPVAAATPRQQRPAGERRPPQERPARTRPPKGETRDSESQGTDDGSPFGSEGPVPAFLLRTSAWSN